MLQEPAGGSLFHRVIQLVLDAGGWALDVHSHRSHPFELLMVLFHHHESYCTAPRDPLALVALMRSLIRGGFLPHTAWSAGAFWVPSPSPFPRVSSCRRAAVVTAWLSRSRAISVSACPLLGIRFIGPEPRVLQLFGDKGAARGLAIECGVAVPAGATSLAEAQRLGGAANRGSGRAWPAPANGLRSE